MQKKIHYLESYDPNLMTGNCAECGPVDVVIKRETGKKDRYQCKVARKKQRYKENYKRYAYKMRDGTKFYVSSQKRDELLEKFGDSCNICGSTENLRLDHCHDSGEWRGVLCNLCNVGLGAFKDSQGSLQSALEYLKSSP